MKRFDPSAGLIVFVLALALGGAALLFAITVLVEVLDHEKISEVPPNASTVLTGIFGGVIGIIGGFVGYRKGEESGAGPSYIAPPGEPETQLPDMLPGHGYPSPEYPDGPPPFPGENRSPDPPQDLPTDG